MMYSVKAEMTPFSSVSASDLLRDLTGTYISQLYHLGEAKTLYLAAGCQ